ncbi:MAG: hypothetical protein KF830_08260 [Planctomycetes bacterium]|nr:hypothetical protein [Planctomycetota bacterium]
MAGDQRGRSEPPHQPHVVGDLGTGRGRRRDAEALHGDQHAARLARRAGGGGRRRQQHGGRLRQPFDRAEIPGQGPGSDGFAAGDDGPIAGPGDEPPHPQDRVPVGHDAQERPFARRLHGGIGPRANGRGKRAPATGGRHDRGVALDVQLADVVLDAAGAALRARLCVPPAHPILRGHFPGAPIVPGVLLLDAVRRAVERVRGRDLALAEVAEVRFVRPLAPGAEARLEATLREEADAVVVEGAWHGEQGRLAAFRLRLGPPA